MCGEKGETAQHIICECKKLAQHEYKRRHDTVAKLVHWKLCEKHNLDRKERWYKHCPEEVVEDDDQGRCYGGVTPTHRLKIMSLLGRFEIFGRPLGR